MGQIMNHTSTKYWIVIRQPTRTSYTINSVIYICFVVIYEDSQSKNEGPITDCQRCGIQIGGYPGFFGQPSIRIIKKLKYPIIQVCIQLSKRVEISKYPCIRILNNLRYPTIHVSIDTCIHGYIQLSIYPCKQVSMDTWILMDKLSFFWLK